MKLTSPKTSMMGAIWWWRPCDLSTIHLGSIPACERRTDGTAMATQQRGSISLLSCSAQLSQLSMVA